MTRMPEDARTSHIQPRLVRLICFHLDIWGEGEGRAKFVGKKRKRKEANTTQVTF